MVAQQRSKDEPVGSDSEANRGFGTGIGTLMFMTACGIGLGLLTAPEAGRQTRKRLRKGLNTLGSEVVDRWGDVHDRFDDAREAGMRAGKKAQKNARKRYAQFRDDAEDRLQATQSRIADLEHRLSHGRARNDDDGSSTNFVTVALGIAAGAGLAYFFMADNAEPARAKVQEMASDLRDQATERWQQFRRGGTRAAADATTFNDEA